MLNTIKTITWKNFHNKSQTTTFELKKNLEGKTSEYWTILMIAQNGISLQNKWGGFNVRNSGKPVYIQKKWNLLHA